MGRILLGADFGTSSVKVVALDTKTGQMVGMAESVYVNGVIDSNLPTGEKLPRDFALQDPSDWLGCLFEATQKLLHETKIPSNEIISLGISFTSSTVLPTDKSGTPLCFKSKLQKNPHAWPKLWKHHAAWPQADKLTKLAVERGELFLANYGGKIGAEWLWPKLLEVIESAPELIPQITYFLEAGDWLVWQLTGKQVRNVCAAGYKACYVEEIGYPSGDYLASASDDLAIISERAKSIPVVQPGRFVGGLLPEMAERLGLKIGLPVGAAVIDAHASVAGAGIYEPGVMVLMMGTSNCHLIMSDKERLFDGYAGIVKDGILDGFWGYEAGQPAAGDMFDWFVNTLAPFDLFERATADDVDVSVILDRWLTEVPSGSNGLLALDWWAGNRSVLMDASLSGAMFGFNLLTRPEEIFKALVEASAFGTRKIIETFIANGIKVEKLVATGSMPFYLPSIVQLYSDVTGLPITVPDVPQSAGRGAAIIGGMSLGYEGLRYNNRQEYFEVMHPTDLDACTPDPVKAKFYDDIFTDWMELHDLLGIQSQSLSRLRKRNFKA